MVLKKRLTNLGSILKRPGAQEEEYAADADTPEANAARGVRLFCESGAANSGQGEEVLHLPTIVESAVASPGAAQAACTQIRKFLSKENYSRPHVQYNAVMLIRILADNPGPSFTKNMDKNFADTVKHLLRNGQDPSVAQILRETLDALDREKAYDTNLGALFTMWRKERGLMANAAKSIGPRTLNAPAWNGPPQASHGSSGRGSSRTLPAPVELVGRIEEARTSAKLLLQLVQSTPPHELLGNELVKEFSERCISAQRSMQGYINCDNPPPDDDTMLTLIETNEQLSLAASKHQRAVLQARRLQGPTPSPPISTVNSNTMPPLGASYNPVVPPANSYQPPPPQPPRPDAPPVLPPLDAEPMRTDVEPSSNYRQDLPLPPALQAGRAKPADEDNPFADHHSPSSEYSVPPGPPPSQRRTEAEEAEEGFRGRTGSPGSYNPGFQSTPSYLGRQESSGNNLTMHGGATQQPRLTEEDEYARDYPANGGRQTPEQGRRGHRESEVSPIAERGAVTYRY
ncbi:hypothetical protein EJ04DRAFT_563190 [Polyplosphaeria fusca]|uniref:GAT domain-containing protein n=1 Tax=Polyplosphaeria fusca TaxID=682080 RepID=A0A9P4QZD8_9PLEO|nr:hypothetical protein EJ04DRAFT_563190 [Polyplosphaeria fusca]